MKHFAVIYKTILLSGIVSLYCLSACSPLDQCNNEILAEYANQAKTHKLVKFDRGCGATTENSIQLSVIPIQEDLKNTGGNIFIAGSISGVDLKNDKSVLISWLDNYTIGVKYDSRLKIFKKESTNGKFKIIYDETKPEL